MVQNDQKMKNKVTLIKFWLGGWGWRGRGGQNFEKNVFFLKWSKMATKWKKSVFGQIYFQNGRPVDQFGRKKVKKVQKSQKS